MTQSPEAAALAAKVNPVLDRVVDVVGSAVHDVYLIGYEAGYRDGVKATVKVIERGAMPGG